MATSDLSATQKLVAATLALHMNDEGGSCFPSLTRLQAETSLSRTAVRDALDELCAGGWITRRRGGGSGRGDVTRYQATLPKGRGNEPTPSSERGNDMTPSASERGHLPTEKGSAGDPEYVREDVTVDDVRVRTDEPEGFPEVAAQFDFDVRQLTEMRAAYRANPLGFRRLARKALDAQASGRVGSAAGLLITKVRDGAHLEADHLRDKPRTSVCPECETGDGRHAVDCPLIKGVAA